MNKSSFLKLFMALIAILLFISCGGDDSNDGPTLSVSPTSVTLDDSNSATLTVSSNTTWNVASSDSWLNCSPSGATGGTQVTVSANSENNTGSARTATLTFTDKTGTKTVTARVTQNPVSKPEESFLTVSPSSLAFDAASGSKSFTISSNVSWTVTSDQSWCTVNKSSGSRESTIEVSVTANTSETSDRTATITVQGEGITAKTVSVSQARKEPDPFLTVSPTSLTFDATSGSKSFTISSNVSWTVTSDQSWCTVNKSSGSRESTIEVSVTANTSETSDRTATITVQGEGITAKTVSVSQARKEPDPFLTVSPTSLTFDATSGSKSFTISSNVSWTVKSDQSWCTVNKSSGSNGASVTVSVTSSTNSSSRSATITVSGGGKQTTVSVTQKGTYTLTVSPTKLTFTSNGGSQSVSVSSNDSWTVSSNQSSWCTVSKSSGANNGSFNVTTTANTQTSSRTATITIKGTNSGIERSVSVTQQPKADSFNPERDDYDSDQNLNSK